MYYRVFEKSTSDSLVFPPTELYNFDKLGINQWDKDLYLMRGSLEFVDQSAESSLAINLKYNKRKYKSQ